MRSPPKKKRARAKGALQKLRFHTAYRANAVLATIFRALFWFFGKRRWQVRDRLDDERAAR
jgi:hypothetical protein